MRRSWLIVCLINFCIAVIMGVLMRLAYVIPMDFNYGYLLHAHSHTVILGWCYLAVYGFIIHSFLSKEEQQKPVYKRLFWITEVAVIGMMLSFPLQGYAFFSILFSTLHIFCSYFFCYLIFKNGRFQSTIDRKILKASMFFMILSTAGVWCLGPAVASGAKDSAFYNLAIQFFLHFQFNGWFVLAVLGLFFNKIQRWGIALNSNIFSKFYKTYIAGIVLSFALPISWHNDSELFTWVNNCGSILQIIALFYLFKLLFPHLLLIKKNTKCISQKLYLIAFICLIFKTFTQLFTFTSEVAIASHSIRNLTVGFIHLIMLGTVNSFLFGFITQSKSFNTKSKLGNGGFLLFLVGFVVMEFLLFHQGLYVFFERKPLNFYPTGLLISSIIILIGLFLLLSHIIQTKKTTA